MTAQSALKKKDFPSGTDTEPTFKANGLVENLKDASGEKKYYYDAVDRLTKVEQGPTGFSVGTNENYVLEYAWNAASQPTQLKLTVRTQSAKTWDYAYYDDGELDTVTNPDGEVTKHEWLSNGRLKKITLRNQGASNKATREFFYQDTNDSHAYVAGKNKHLRKTLDKKQDGTVICSFEYELDKTGIRLSLKDKDAKYYKYGYDPRYQLKNENKWSAKVGGTRNYQLLWNYDGNGNRISQHRDGVLTGYNYGDNNEMTSAGLDTFAYDHFGNTKTKLAGVSATTYNYDFESHITSIDYPATSNDDTHEYDGNGRRMRSKLAGAADWTNFVHDELTENIICEYTLISGTFTIKSLNTHGVGLISTNREGTKRYFHFDGLGSTRALTDASEVVQDTYEYSAFGTLESSTGSSVNPFRYVGQWGYYDDGSRGSQSGLLLLGVRYYSVAHGRFWTWDPVPNLALYGYANASPTMLIDPTGFTPCEKFSHLQCLRDCIAACQSQEFGNYDFCWEWCAEWCLLMGKGLDAACDKLFQWCLRLKPKKHAEACLGVYLGICFGK